MGVEGNPSSEGLMINVIRGMYEIKLRGNQEKIKHNQAWVQTKVNRPNPAFPHPFSPQPTFGLPAYPMKPKCPRNTLPNSHKGREG